MEKDRNDNFLYEKYFEEINATLSDGRFLGDYVTWDKTKKTFVPFEWKISVNDTEINNTMAPTCFYCHSAKSFENIESAAKGTLNFRMAVTSRYFAAADIAGGLIGSIGDNHTISYNSTLFIGDELSGDNIILKDDKACAHCHGVFQFDDFDNDGKITPLDFVKAAKDPKFMHPDAMKEAMVWQYSTNFTTEEGYSKNIDIHKKKLVEEGKTTENKLCIYCHSSVQHSYQGEGYAPDNGYWFASHDFAKGSCGPAFGVMWNQLSGSLTCQKCHSTANDDHKAYFGPAAGTHLDNIACTTCHIGKKYFYRVKLIDWSLPMFAFSGAQIDPTNATDILGKVAGLDKHGYLWPPVKSIDDSVDDKYLYEDIAWLPERDFETGEVKWKLKPVNAMGVLLFEDNSSGEFKPVLARYLAKVFKVDPSLPTKYMKVEIDPATKQPKRVPVADGIQILNIKVVKGKAIESDTDLNSGNWTLWRATPNYIDVDLDGKYTEGVDVQITDDTGLTGTTDGDPELNRKEEVEAAINTLKKVIAKATKKSEDEIEVKLVATTDAFGMSHNIRPAEEALECADCHGGKSTGLEGTLFAGTTPLYFPYEEAVETADYFVKKIDRAPTLEEYAEHIKAELVEAGYGEETTTTEAESPAGVVVVPDNVNVTVSDDKTTVTMKIEYENTTVNATATIINATVIKEDTEALNTPDKLVEIGKDFEVSKVFAAIVVEATSTFTVEFDITGLDPDKLTVKTSGGKVIDKDVSGNTLTATIDPTRAGGNSITVALVEEPETAETPAGGGGGGCSINPSAGLGGSISYLLGLLPLAFLRRRKEN